MPVPETSDLTGYKISFQEYQINLAIWGKKWIHLNLTLQDSSGQTYSCSDANQIIWRKRDSTCWAATGKQDNVAQQDTPCPPKPALPKPWDIKPFLCCMAKKLMSACVDMKLTQSHGKDKIERNL